MRILFVSEYYPPHIGGVETVFQNLCEGLVKRGHDVILVTCKLPGSKDIEIVNGVMIHRVKVPRKGSRYWFTFLSIPQVFKIARKADLVHTTTYNGAFPSRLVCKVLGKKCVITVHEILGPLWDNFTNMSRLSSKSHRFLEKMVMSLSFDRFVCVSEYTGNSVKNLGIPSNKIEIIYNGIDYDLFNPNVAKDNRIRQKLNIKDNFIYLSYGRPGISKGIEYLVQAVPLISQKIPESKLILILAHEPKENYENIKNLIRDSKMESRIILLDPVQKTELRDYIMASDCVVVPSLSEGFGFTAAEACAMRKPVVACNVGSLPEVVSGKCVFVEPKKYESIADGVIKIYNGEYEQKPERLFKWSECIEKYISLYLEMLNDASRLSDT
jgi:D-inositol-3-phosphate glycosyltransferase